MTDPTTRRARTNPAEAGEKAADERAPASTGPRTAWPLVKRFWPWMRPHIRYVAIVVAIQAFVTPIAIAVPLIIRRVVDQAIAPEATSEVLRWAGILIALAVLGVGLSLLAGWSLTIFRTKVVADLRLRLFRQMQGLSWAYYASRETGDA